MNRNNQTIMGPTSMMEIKDQQVSVRKAAAPLHISELTLGRKITSSCDSYCDVHEIKGIVRTDQSMILQTEGKLDTSEILCRETFLRQVKNSSQKGSDGPSKKFVVKFVKEEWMENHQGFEIAACRLATEDRLLSQLSHPNIPNIYGRASEGTEAYYLSGGNDSYFIVLEQMKATLFERIKMWRRRRDSSSKRIHHILGPKSKRRSSCKASKSRMLLMERLKVAMDLASALTYLHSQKMVHRNIHPGNIAFDSRGDVKLVGFGMAKKIDNSSSTFSLYGDDHHNDPLSESVTSTAEFVASRYTACEVLCGEEHGTASDVFSFTTLLFELLTLPESLKKVKKRNSLDNTPQSSKIKDDSIPTDLQYLIEQGWHRDPLQRPSMRTMAKVLQRAFEDLENEELSSFQISSTKETAKSSNSSLESQSNVIKTGGRKARSVSMSHVKHAQSSIKRISEPRKTLLLW